MKGNELAAAIRQQKGKVIVPMVCPHDVAMIVAVKSDLIEWAKEFGERETGMQLYAMEQEGYTRLDVA